MDEPGGGLASEGGHPLLERGRALGESAGLSHSWERRPGLGHSRGDAYRDARAG